jgi:hypothetical protein
MGIAWSYLRLLEDVIIGQLGKILTIEFSIPEGGRALGVPRCRIHHLS